MFETLLVWLDRLYSDYLCKLHLRYNFAEGSPLKIDRLYVHIFHGPSEDLSRF